MGLSFICALFQFRYFLDGNRLFDQSLIDLMCLAVLIKYAENSISDGIGFFPEDEMTGIRYPYDLRFFIFQHPFSEVGIGRQHQPVFASLDNGNRYFYVCATAATFL